MRALGAGLIAAALLAVPDVVPSLAAPAGQPVVGQTFPAAVEIGLLVEASLTLNPAADTVVVSFPKAFRARRATLEQLGEHVGNAAPSTDWAPAARTKKLDSKGRVTFQTDVVAGESYRVRLAASGLRPAVHSPVATLADQWNTGLNEEFDGTALDADWWSDRAVGAQMPSRLCSLPSASPTLRFVGDGELTAGITRHLGDAYFKSVVAKTNQLDKARLKRDLASAGHLRSKHKRRAAIAKARAQYKLTHNCPRGAFENTMVSTQKNTSGFRVNTSHPGIVAARVKFPAAQGMHTGVWLQSYVRGGGEIDIAETFGYGSGLFNYIHIPTTGKMDQPGSPKALKKKGGRVIHSKTSSRAWWKGYHEVSVEWTATKFVFRTDGKVTRTVKLKPGNADYYLILSLLSSDWELPRLKHPIGKGKPTADVSGQKLMVDWVRIWGKVA